MVVESNGIKTAMPFSHFLLWNEYFSSLNNQLHDAIQINEKIKILT